MNGLVRRIVEYLYSSLDTLYAGPPKYSMTSNEYLKILHTKQCNKIYFLFIQNISPFLIG